MSRAQLGAQRREVALVARTRARIREVRDDTLGNPFTHQHQQRLAVGAGLREHQVHAIDPGCLTDQPEHAGDRHPGILRFEQQAAGLGRGGEQPFPAPQRLVDLGQLFGARGSPDFRFQSGHGRIHGDILSSNGG